MKSGATANIELSRCAKTEEQLVEFIIYGEKGYAELPDYWKARKVIFCDHKESETLEFPCEHELVYEAEHIARAAKIPTVYDRPEEMLGNIDAVIVATDDGNEHVERCRPFVEAGIPMFIDKPITIKEDEAIELAKRFDDDNGSSFVNGILGSFARAQSAPEKEEV